MILLLAMGWRHKGDGKKSKYTNTYEINEIVISKISTVFEGPNLTFKGVSALVHFSIVFRHRMYMWPLNSNSGKTLPAPLGP